MKSLTNRLALIFSLVIFSVLSACGGGGGGGDAAAAPPTSAALPETGQATCTNAAGGGIACAGTGQDGEHLARAPWPNPRFTVGTGATVSARTCTCATNCKGAGLNGRKGLVAEIHGLRTIHFGTDCKLYIPVGAPGDICMLELPKNRK